MTHSVPADLLPSARTWDVPTWVDYLAHRIKGEPFDARRWVTTPKVAATEETVIKAPVALQKGDDGNRPNGDPEPRSSEAATSEP